MKFTFAVSMMCILEGIIPSARSSLNSGEIKFSIFSSRNDSGHWNAQIQLEHGDNDGLPLRVGIDHKTTRNEEAESVLIVTNISAPPQRPGPGYELIPKLGYYKFHIKPKNWFEARKNCENEGAHLAIINSEEESKALLRFWLPHPKINDGWKNEYAFVGAHDNYKEGQYVTIFDVPLNATGYANWADGQPNGGSSQNCLSVKRNVGAFNDANCNEEIGFFCEKELH